MLFATSRKVIKVYFLMSYTNISQPAYIQICNTYHQIQRVSYRIADYWCINPLFYLGRIQGIVIFRTFQHHSS